MLTVQLRKDPSVFPTQQIVHREHTLQMYAKLHFRYCGTYSLIYIYNQKFNIGKPTIANFFL